MPGGDRTGPAGMGPMTGRAAGYCTGNQMPGFANPVAGRGYGFGGRGRGGMGRRNGFYATGLFGWQRFGTFNQPAENNAGFTTANKEQELGFLKNQVQNLASAIDDIKKRIAVIESPDSPQRTGRE